MSFLAGLIPTIGKGLWSGLKSLGKALFSSGGQQKLKNISKVVQHGINIGSSLPVVGQHIQQSDVLQGISKGARSIEDITDKYGGLAQQAGRAFGFGDRGYPQMYAPD